MRRLSLALLVIAAFAGSAFAQEQKATARVTKKDLQAMSEAAPLMPLTLSALFAIASEQIVTDGVVIPAEVPNIIFARKNEDGTITTTCVSSIEAGRSFVERRQRDEPSKPAEQ
jgi:hypothetical protein